MRTMHLFAGIGGGLLADLILGHTPVVAVEWEPYACKVLRERAADGWFPGLSVWEGDVRLFDPSEYTGKVDCIHAGFPCQDISVAGKQAGVSEGTRSGLYREVLRIAGVVRPKQLFLENVSAILSNGLGTVLADLAALGYDTRWLCIRASDVGAPHHRDRWFLLANVSGRRCSEPREGQVEQPRRTEVISASDVSHADSDNWRPSGLGQDTRTNGRDELGGICEVLADTRHAGLCERGQFVNAGESLQQPRGIHSNGVSRSCNEEGQVLADTKCQRLQGSRKPELAKHSAPSSDWETTEFVNGGESCIGTIKSGLGELADGLSNRFCGYWETEPEIGRVASGVANRVGQLKGYGNAQVPLQAATAYRLLGGI